MTELSLIQMVHDLTQFGVAGLMGVLWVWERSMSRKRERQLTQTHEHLTRRNEELETLVRLVDRNARAFDRFAEKQHELHHLLEMIRHETHHHPTT